MTPAPRAHLVLVADDGALFWSVAALVGTRHLAATALREHWHACQVGGSVLAAAASGMIVGFAWYGHDARPGPA